MTKKVTRRTTEPFDAVREIILKKILPTFTPEETELARIEQNWADFAARVRTGKGRRARSLLYVHSLLELHRETLKTGDKSALLWALRTCCEENVPLPYWVADGILDIIKQVQKRPISLHDLFGLHKRRLRASGKRADADRDDLRHSGKLWREAAALISQGISRDAALRRVLQENRFPFQLRKAVELYEERDRWFKRHIKATAGTK